MMIEHSTLRHNRMREVGSVVAFGIMVTLASFAIFWMANFWNLIL
jgi:hypothetical protein